jgi:hypothetical protein
MDSKNNLNIEFIKELFQSERLVINDLISGKSFSARDVKAIKMDGDTIEVNVCDKEIQLVVDDEILGCFTKNELELIQSELEMAFPFAVITIIEGNEHSIITRGLSSNETDIVTYNIRQVFEDSIARITD